MPIIKKNDVTPERPVIIVLYGQPGSGKTSLSTTAENPVLIDTDRGFDRAAQRVDTLVAQTWQDILSEYETLKGYKTIIVDTARAVLDDYLAAYVCEQNYKLKTNALKRYGQMGEEFKAFVNFLRSNGSDIVFICHDKEDKDGDATKHSPDCTGQSKDLLIRIADQVGYVGIQNKQRVVSFEPLDNYVGKNVAQLGPIAIPDAPSKEFDSCMTAIIKRVKECIQSKSEAQRKAQEQLSALRGQIDAVETLDDVDIILKASKSLPAVMKGPFFTELKEALGTKGFTYDIKAKKFVKDEKADSADNAD